MLYVSIQFPADLHVSIHSSISFCKIPDLDMYGNVADYTETYMLTQNPNEAPNQPGANLYIIKVFFTVNLFFYPPKI